jgi:26S proteasome regulatory subunit N2
MLKKVTTERAPVAGQQNGRGGAGSRMTGSRELLGALQGSSGGTNAMVDQLLGSSRSPFDMITDHLGEGSGAAAAAGVLTAVDEDEEDDEEAEMPDEFEYFSDATDSDD